jgi:hypothetical protein
VLDYTYYRQADYYQTGNLQREIEYERLQASAEVVATLCGCFLKALGVVAHVTIASAMNRNPYKLPR